MNIQIITPYLIYPDVPHGGGQDLFDLIVYFNVRHKIRVASFVDAEQAAHASALQPYVEDLQLIHPAITFRQKVNSIRGAFSKLRFHVPGQRAGREMRAIASQDWADVLYCAWTEMGRFIPLAAKNTATILDEVDVRFLVDELAMVKNAAQRKKDEIRYCRSADMVITRSNRDLHALKTTIPSLNGMVVPPIAHVEDFMTVSLDDHTTGRVVFVGAMNRKRNQQAVHWLVQEIWPHVRSQNQKAHLRIVGANPPPEIISLGQFPDIEVTGYIKNLYNEYAAAHVIVAPMQSEAGILNKVLDGLAAGRPVVATSVANAGLAAPPDVIYLADQAAAFAHAITTLLKQDKKQLEIIGKKGRQFVKEAFNRKASLDELESRIAYLLQSKGAQYKG